MMAKDRGPLACDRCGGRIEQPATGRRRRYCGRTCRELAYRARATDRKVTEALEKAGVPTAPDSSVVERQSVPVTSVVESRPPGRKRSGMTASAMPLPED